MKTNFITILFFSIFIFVALKCEKKHNTLEPDGAVSAIFETEPVGSSGDTADDPCVWVHPTDPSLSIIIGTDKDENSPGLRVYDMSGKQIYFTTNEKANNVDIRYGMVLAGKKTDIITAGLRVSNALGVYKVNPASRTLTSISAIPLSSRSSINFLIFLRSIFNPFVILITMQIHNQLHPSQ